MLNDNVQNIYGPIAEFAARRSIRKKSVIKSQNRAPVNPRIKNRGFACIRMPA
jgi:hypothetical protein